MADSQAQKVRLIERTSDHVMASRSLQGKILNIVMVEGKDLQAVWELKMLKSFAGVTA